jgi:hypothetical protein
MPGASRHLRKVDMLDPVPARASAFAPGETSVVAYEAAPCLPPPGFGAIPCVLATEPAPTATPPAGSGLTVPAVAVSANPVSGLDTDILVEVAVASTAARGDYPITLEFQGSDGVTVKRRVLIIPVRAGF